MDTHHLAGKAWATSNSNLGRWNLKSAPYLPFPYRYRASVIEILTLWEEKHRNPGSTLQQLHVGWLVRR
jgi:hypothetical protein